MGIKYTDEEKLVLEAEKFNPDHDEGNAAIVNVVADKMGKQAFNIPLPASGDHLRYEDKDGTYQLKSGEKPVTKNLKQAYCVDKGCGVAFTYLPVSGCAYGYFVNDKKHEHAPHLIPALVETCQLLALVHVESDADGKAPFLEAYSKVISMFSTPGPIDMKCSLYVVIDPRVAASKIEFEALPLEEKFNAIMYTGQTEKEIGERFDNQVSHNLFNFTCNGTKPKFIVLHTPREMSASQATFWETRVMTATASHHAVFNCHRPATWKWLSGVSREEDYMATSIKVLQVLESGAIHEVDWTDKLRRTKRKPPPISLGPETDESSSPSVTQLGWKVKRKQASSSATTTPVSAFNHMALSAPGSVTIQTDSSFFTFDGTLTGFDASRAELYARLDEERKKLLRQEQEEESSEGEDETE